VSIHFLDDEIQGLPAGFFVTGRNFSKQVKHKAAQGIKTFLGQVDVDFIIEVFYIDTGITEPGRSTQGDDVFTFVIEFVLDVTDYLFDDVFHADDAGDSAVFVYGNGNMDVAALEFPEEGVYPL